MATNLRADSTAKKDIQKLQRAIVDGLEDVKAQDIQVFDTETQSALFERVVVASGTSNRQTKALAASVVDAVRKAGLPKPRMEGEENGEWIIVDCGQAVVHIMQPAIRLYYRLEDLWGDKPVRLKLGAAKPAAPGKTSGHGKQLGATSVTPAKKTSRAAGQSAGAEPAKAAPKTSARTASKAPAKTAVKTSARSSTSGAKRTTSTPAKAPAKVAAKASAKRVVVGAPKPARKAAAKK